MSTSNIIAAVLFAVLLLTLCVLVLRHIPRYNRMQVGLPNLPRRSRRVIVAIRHRIDAMHAILGRSPSEWKSPDGATRYVIERGGDYDQIKVITWVKRPDDAIEVIVEAYRIPYRSSDGAAFGRKSQLFATAGVAEDAYLQFAASDVKMEDLAGYLRLERLLGELDQPQLQAFRV